MKEHLAVHKFRRQTRALISQSIPSETGWSLRWCAGCGHTKQTPSDFG